jgi:hypothetical protein
MTRVPIPILELSDELSDQAVAQLVESLYELARTLENHYAAQLYRHYHRVDERQRNLCFDDDPPF